MDKQNDLRPKKKSIWTLLKESMDKSSSGCGPGCGCHAEKPRRAARKSTPDDAANDGKQA
ncbi:MAG: hypothetical protein ACM3VW_03455 [Bacteroidota bacterium]